MDATTFYIIFFTSLTSLWALDKEVADALNRIFWFPYVCFMRLNYSALNVITESLNKRLKHWEFGYGFKLCLKINYFLITFNMGGLIMKGVRFDKPHTFVCKCDADLPVEEQTKFKVKFLTAKQQAKIRDMMYNVSGAGNARSERFLTGSSVLKALELGLLGWDDFYYEGTKEEIPFTIENFSCIPPNNRDEIANYIRGIEEGEV